MRAFQHGVNALSLFAREAFTGPMPVHHTPIDSRVRVAAEVHAFCRENDAPRPASRTPWATFLRLLRTAFR